MDAVKRDLKKKKYIVYEYHFEIKIIVPKKRSGVVFFSPRVAR